MIRDFIVRDAQAEDIPGIQKLCNTKGVREYLPFVMRVTMEDYISKMDEGDTRHHLIVVEKADKVIGFSRFLHRARPVDGRKQTTAHETAVHPNYRGKGVGQALFDTRLQSMQDNGSEILFFKAKVDNPARKFFLKNECQMVGKDAKMAHYRRDITLQKSR